MKNIYSTLIAVAVACIAITSCQEQEIVSYSNIPEPEVLLAIEAAGFKIDDVYKSDDGSYWFEGDYNFTFDQIKAMKRGNVFAEQYNTDNLVATGGSRVITIYINAASGSSSSTAVTSSTINEARGGNGKGGGGGGGSRGSSFSATYGLALDETIARYNAVNLELTLQRVSSGTDADIVISRLGKGEERRGILGSAGFPTVSGEPYGEIKLSGILESAYGLSVEGIATIMAHEEGHCIGFRHTDYFDRSISCGGGSSNEGEAGIGANHIPGTPTGADPSTDLSWMLACTDGGDRPFTTNDKIALDYLY